MRPPLGLTLAAALALGMTPAMAQPAPDPSAAPAPANGGQHHGARGFDAMDANHDGVVTMDEWKAAGRREERFAMIDVNHDGKITREEMQAAMERMRAWREQHGGGDWHQGGGDQGSTDQGH